MDQQFLRKLLNQISVSGCEESGQKVLKEYMGQYADEIRPMQMKLVCLLQELRNREESRQLNAEGLFRPLIRGRRCRS